MIYGQSASDQDKENADVQPARRPTMHWTGGRYRRNPTLGWPLSSGKMMVDGHVGRHMWSVICVMILKRKKPMDFPLELCETLNLGDSSILMILLIVLCFFLFILIFLVFWKCQFSITEICFWIWQFLQCLSFYVFRSSKVYCSNN